MADAQSMARGAGLAEHPRRTRTYRRRRWSDLVKGARSHTGRHRAPCQSPPTLAGVPARALSEDAERAEARALLAWFDGRHESWERSR